MGYVALVIIIAVIIRTIHMNKHRKTASVASPAPPATQDESQLPLFEESLPVPAPRIFISMLLAFLSSVIAIISMSKELHNTSTRGEIWWGWWLLITGNVLLVIFHFLSQWWPHFSSICLLLLSRAMLIAVIIAEAFLLLAVVTNPWCGGSPLFCGLLFLPIGQWLLMVRFNRRPLCA
jgi:hypothetical protein